jgi:hypothetical protein
MKHNGHRRGAVVLVAVIGLAGCGGGGSPHRALGDAAIISADAVARAGVFHQPLDAAPTANGNTIYFVATGVAGPAVYSVAATGGAPSVVATGAPLAKPTGVAVATDSSRIFVADQQAQQPGTTSSAAGGATAGRGAILTVAVSGPTSTPGAAQAPTIVAGTQGLSPRGLDVVNQGDSDLIYFTGTDPANSLPGLFEVPALGGTVLTIAEGAPFMAPDSVVVTADGVAYVSDQGPGPNQGKVFRVTGDTVIPVLSALDLGTPAGVTLIHSDATLLVSTMDPTTTADQVLFLDLPTGKTAAASKVIGANKASSGGLHRAHSANVLAWADIQGPVYRVRYP